MIKLRPWKETKNEFEVDIIVNGPDGRTLRKRVKAPVAGKSNAERWARSFEQEMLMQFLAPEPEPEKPPAPTFEEFAVIFLDLCKANRLAVNTLMNYEVHLRLYLLPVLARRRLDEVKPVDITAIKVSLARKARGTMTEVLKTLRRVFTVAIEQRYITQEPVKLDIPARIHKLPIAYDEVDVKALLAAAQVLGPDYVAMVLLGIDGGLRRGEILGLQWSDLSLGRASMTVRHNIVRGQLGVPKGRTEEDVGLTQRLAVALVAVKHNRGPFVFSTDDGGHYKEHDIKRWMHQLVTAAKLTWHGTHVLRKTCGTRIADGGGGVAAVASHLRHKSLSTASRYIDRNGASSRALKALES
jgi:integrase